MVKFLLENCSMLLVDWINFSGVFYGYNLLGIEVISDPKWLVKYPWKFRGLELKNIEEKMKISSDKPWGAALARAFQDSLSSSGSSPPRLSEHQRCLETPFLLHLFILVPKLCTYNS